jgi:hypothetical protein
MRRKMCIYKCMLNVYKNQQNLQTGSRNLMDPKTLSMIWGTYMKLATKYQIYAINSCWENCDEKCAYMFNVYTNQLSRQTGSRNRTDPKTLPTIWYAYLTHATKYQISAVNSYWENATTILNGRKDDGRTKDGQTYRGKTVLSPPLWGAGDYLDMCCIVCVTIHPYVMASRFRLCRDSYFQATNHQWAYLLKLDTRQDMLINWSLPFNSISFAIMWGSIFSIYQSPVSLLFKIV